MHPSPSERFRALPLLLSYSDVIECGIKPRDLAAYVKTGQITFVQTHARGRRHYRKRDIATLLGLES